MLSFTCAHCTSMLPLHQIWKEDLHPAARRACPLLHVQAPSGLHRHHSHWVWLCHTGQENRWILWCGCQYHCQRRSNAAGQKGPVSNTLQTGTPFYTSVTGLCSMCYCSLWLIVTFVSFPMFWINFGSQGTRAIEIWPQRYCRWPLDSLLTWGSPGNWNDVDGGPRGKALGTCSLHGKDIKLLYFAYVSRLIYLHIKSLIFFFFFSVWHAEVSVQHQANS